jgi:hypothetical protein
MMHIDQEIALLEAARDKARAGYEEFVKKTGVIFMMGDIALAKMAAAQARKFNDQTDELTRQINTLIRTRSADDV